MDSIFVEPHEFTNLGAQPRVKQPDDLLGSATPGLVIPDQKVSPKAFGSPIYYQAHEPACGAHSGGWMGAYKLNIPAPGISPRFTWADIKKNGSDTNPNDGCTMPDIFRSLLTTGVDEWDPLENDVTLAPAQYATPTITDAMTAYATAHKLMGVPHYVDNPTFEELKTLIFEHETVIMLLRIGATWWTKTNGTVSWTPQDILPIRPTPNVVSGHFVVGHSYTLPWVFFANSFGRNWGIGGHGYFGADYIPYVEEVGYLA